MKFVSSKAILASAVALTLSAGAFADDVRPLTKALSNNDAGKFMTDNSLTVGGFIEASNTWSVMHKASGNFIPGRAFDFESDDLTLNQVGMWIDKSTDITKAWDIGGRIEGIFGADARFTASNGMDFDFGASSPNNQFDLFQAYVEVVVPMSDKAIKLKVGKFSTNLGYEYVNPTLNSLYSHSFLFGIVPYTHTGILGTYDFGNGNTLAVGVSRGWDQSLKDNNDMPDFLVFWTGKWDDKTTYAINLSTGPENSSNSNWRTAVDFWADYAMSDQLTIGVNGDFVYDSAAGQNGDASHVYGLAVYGKYKVNDYVGVNSRVEWFDDTDRTSGFDSVVYEATIGLTVTPMPDNEYGKWLKIRPEVRYDYSENDIFGNGDENDQLTVALEANYSF